MKLAVVSLLSALLFSVLAHHRGYADDLTPGYYLVANGNKITEYDTAGNVVQQFVVPPIMNGGFVKCKDLCIDKYGRIHVLQITERFGFDYYLSTYDPATGSWQHNTMDGWILHNVLYYGGLGVNDEFVFAPDHMGGGDNNEGILRFPLDDLSNPILFQDDLGHDITVGLNGDIYALERHGDITRIDPNTFQIVDQVYVGGSSMTGFAIAANGDMFISDLDNELHHFDTNGNWIETVPLVGATAGIDLELSGETLLIGSGGESITVLNINDLSNQTVFDTSAQNREWDDYNYVTFVSETIQSTNPVDVTVVLGTNTLGDLNDVTESDDEYFCFLNGFPFSAGGPSVWLEFEGSLPTETPGALGVTIEAQASSNDIHQKVYAFNYDTTTWELLDTSATGFNTDTVVSFDMTGDLARFVENGTGKTKLRVTYTQGPAAIFLIWTVCLDHVAWRFTE